MGSRKKKRPGRTDLVAAVEARFRSNPVGASLVTLFAVATALSGVPAAIKAIRDLIPARAAPTNVAIPLPERATHGPGREERASPRGTGRGITPQGDAAAAGFDSVLLRLEPGVASSVRRVLELSVRARFRTARFNVRDYLRSVQDVRRDDGGGQPTFPWESGSRFAVDSIEPGGLRGRLVVEWPADPAPGRWLPVRLGPYRDSVDIGKLEWIAHELPGDSSGGRWWLARGAVEVALPDPSWPLLLSSRLLPTTTASRSILEVTFHNASDAPAAVNAVVFSGWFGVRADCLLSGPAQIVELDWRRLRATQGAEGAWTAIGGDTVPVRARFKMNACSGGASLTLPTDIVVEAHDIRHFIFEMVERGASGGRRPSWLQQITRPDQPGSWNGLRVAVGPSGQFFPVSVAVDR